MNIDYHFEAFVTVEVPATRQRKRVELVCRVWRYQAGNSWHGYTQFGVWPVFEDFNWPRPEWNVPREHLEQVTALLGGITAGAITAPLIDLLQEINAPEWVWKGVADTNDWYETIPWQRGERQVGKDRYGNE